MADYVDIDMMHAYGGYKDPTEEHDALLEVMISAASAAIDDFCNRTFASEETAVIEFTRNNGLLPKASERTLWLPFDLCSQPVIAPVIGVTLIPTYPPYDRLVLDDDEDPWPEGVTIEGHWAYSETPPVVIVRQCLRLTKWLVDQKETSTDTDRPIVTPGGVVILPSRLPSDVEALLIPYRRITMP